MAIDLSRLRDARIPDAQQRYDWRDCARYALALGVGLDPLDESDLAYLDETRLKVEPTLVNVLADPGFWLRDLPLGLDWRRTVHGEQSIRLHRPPAPQGNVRGVTRIVDVADKGADKGALLYVERDLFDLEDGGHLATLRQTVFCRGDGGYGGAPAVRPPPAPLPARAPDLLADCPTSPQAALIYRLSADLNPLHIDPASARRAGFPRPILHGMASFGVAGHGLVRHCCAADPRRMLAMDGRFRAPVYPGETLRLEIWMEAAGQARYRAIVRERDAVAIDNGSFEFGT
ncbi:MaoC/PaaZ C-terminal domain-containing protein [Bordetella hinzii]|jgi:acyl dehydratase|uniref:MaoC/PaaZ C-terminal domain-containing protein n=1 Tax=Bordetella hinzii TaxID=103855 RepID=UPI00045B03D8|nr:MaoC/PaaZ C-terminal domain-containing protein [Bordetella hinzii]KCB41183.1 MaoC-like protein [Bordetella hinzii 4161]KXA72593.1 3-alpha,7-alpha,12-alpha-trihydroxy-5-beta-cholest-24-enoyl-CoA hydratase [Bordetella hinzii LMG 13501]QDJ35174.1 3-alpha,7-alpha,12-alpha-trihydroxy-5-beta-cholest-24-enoyl-CoA hydratase [Bordetella hinzii]VEH23369.1 hydratase [Bordetella hinzii]